MSEQKTSRQTLWVVAGVLLAAFIVALVGWMTLPPLPAGAPPVQKTASAETPPALPVVSEAGADFVLPSTRGGELALADLRGKVVLLNFGFTSCPDVCPLTLARMSHALRALASQGVDMNQVQPLFITFDPARDTLPVMTTYLGNFHPLFIGLRGDEQQTAALARQYRAIYLRQQAEAAAGDYAYTHTDFVYVLDQQGRVRLLVGSKDPVIVLTQAVQSLLRG